MRLLFSLSVLTVCLYLTRGFSITAPKELYEVEKGDNVTLLCTFPVGKELNQSALMVYWQRDEEDVIQFVGGHEDQKSQHGNDKGRFSLPKDQLLKGNAALQITDVKLQDAGVYMCMISYGGADYKRITLKVNAPYRKINQRISVDPATSEHELICQAEGYPEAEVTWTFDSENRTFSVNTSVEEAETRETATKWIDVNNQTHTNYSYTPLSYNVTSILKVSGIPNETISCTFNTTLPGSNFTAQLVIPATMPSPGGNWSPHLGLLGLLGLMVTALALAIILYRKGDCCGGSGPPRRYVTEL